MNDINPYNSQSYSYDSNFVSSVACEMVAEAREAPEQPDVFKRVLHKYGLDTSETLPYFTYALNDLRIKRRRQIAELMFRHETSGGRGMRARPNFAAQFRRCLRSQRCYATYDVPDHLRNFREECNSINHAARVINIPPSWVWRIDPNDFEVKPQT